MAGGGSRVGAGRRPVPTALRALRGAKGAKLGSGMEPQYGPADENPPDEMTPEEREIWTRLVPRLIASRVMTAADRDSAVLAVQALADYHRARAIVLREGDTYESEDSRGGRVIRAHPAVSMAADAWRRAEAALSKFGLDPSSRTKIRVEPQRDLDPVAQWRARHGA